MNRIISMQIISDITFEDNQTQPNLISELTEVLDFNPNAPDGTDLHIEGFNLPAPDGTDLHIEGFNLTAQDGKELNFEGFNLPAPDGKDLHIEGFNLSAPDRKDLHIDQSTIAKTDLVPTDNLLGLYEIPTIHERKKPGLESKLTRQPNIDLEPSDISENILERELDRETLKTVIQNNTNAYDSPENIFESEGTYRSPSKIHNAANQPLDPAAGLEPLDPAAGLEPLDPAAGLEPLDPTADLEPLTHALDTIALDGRMENHEVTEINPANNTISLTDLEDQVL